MVPPYVVAEAWIVLLGPAGKLSRPLARLAGFGPPSTDRLAVARFTVPPLVYSWPAAGVVLGGCLFPIVALTVAAAWRHTDGRAFEAARLAQGRRGVVTIAARVLALPAAGAGLLVFAVTLTEFAVPQLLRFRGVGEVVYEQIQAGDLPAAAAASLPVLPVVVLAGAAGAVALGRSRVASLAALEGEVSRFAGRPAGWVGHVAAVGMTVVAALPAVVLPAVSLTWLALSAARPEPSKVGTHHLLRASGFRQSLAGAWDLVSGDATRTAVWATVAATVAVAASVAVVRLAPRLRLGSAVGAIGAGLAVPAPIVGLGLIALWDRAATAAVYRSVAVVLLAWLARFLPLVVLLVQTALARVPPELEAAAALAGRGPLARLGTVVVRSAAPGLAAAWVAMYVLSATEFNTTVLVAPPGQPLLAPSVVNLMRRGQDPEIAACQVLLLAVVAVPLVVVAAASSVRWRPR